MTTLKELSQLSGSMDCGDFYFRDLDTGKTRTYLNYANKIDIKETANSQFAKAKGKNSIEFQEPTEFEISMDVQMWNPSLLGLIHGGEPVQGAENFAKREKHKVATANGDVVLSGVPYANKIDVYVLGEDEVTHLKELEVSYDADSKTVTCTVAEALFPPTVAVIVALPFFLAVTTPSTTVAIDLSELVHSILS